MRRRVEIATEEPQQPSRPRVILAERKPTEDDREDIVSTSYPILVIRRGRFGGTVMANGDVRES
jgi:hypothetical protein